MPVLCTQVLGRVPYFPLFFFVSLVDYSPFPSFRSKIQIPPRSRTPRPSGENVTPPYLPLPERLFFLPLFSTRQQRGRFCHSPPQHTPPIHSEDTREAGGDFIPFLASYPLFQSDTFTVTSRLRPLPFSAFAFRPVQKRLRPKIAEKRRQSPRFQASAFRLNLSSTCRNSPLREP